MTIMGVEMTKHGCPSPQGGDKADAVSAAPKSAIATTSMYDYCKDNLDRMKRNHDQFQRVFGISVMRFKDALMGFDVIAFDDFVCPHPGESTSDAIKRKWGIEADTIVRNLIGSK